MTICEKCERTPLHLAESDEMRDFLRDLNPAAFSYWVMTVLYSDVVLTYVTFISSTSCVVLSCLMQEKEQQLIEACQRGDFEKAKRLVSSGVSVKCRNQVVCVTGSLSYFLDK